MQFRIIQTCALLGSLRVLFSLVVEEQSTAKVLAVHAGQEAQAGPTVSDSTVQPCTCASLDEAP